jgi:hypothetical protein
VCGRGGGHERRIFFPVSRCGLPIWREWSKAFDILRTGGRICCCMTYTEIGAGFPVPVSIPTMYVIHPQPSSQSIPWEDEKQIDPHSPTKNNKCGVWTVPFAAPFPSPSSTIPTILTSNHPINTLPAPHITETPIPIPPPNNKTHHGRNSYHQSPAIHLAETVPRRLPALKRH